MNDDVKISRRATINSGLAFALQPQSRSCFNSGGNLYFDRLLLFDAPGAAAGFARRGNHLPSPATRSAGTRDGKETLLKADLPHAFAGAANLRLRAFLCARAFAGPAAFQLGNSQLRGHTGRGLLQT